MKPIEAENTQNEPIETRLRKEAALNDTYEIIRIEEDDSFTENQENIQSVGFDREDNIGWMQKGDNEIRSWERKDQNTSKTILPISEQIDKEPVNSLEVYNYESKTTLPNCKQMDKKHEDSLELNNHETMNYEEIIRIMEAIEEEDNRSINAKHEEMRKDIEAKKTNQTAITTMATIMATTTITKAATIITTTTTTATKAATIITTTTTATNTVATPAAATTNNNVTTTATTTTTTKRKYLGMPKNITSNKPTKRTSNLQVLGGVEGNMTKNGESSRNVRQKPTNTGNEESSENVIQRPTNTRNNTSKRTLMIEEIKGGFEQHTRDKNVEIPENIKIILSLGEKFIIPYKRYELEEIITMVNDIEDCWDETPIGEKSNNFSEWKNQVIKEMVKTNVRFTKINRSIINAIMELEEFMVKNKDLYIARTDKGKKTIIMEKSEFKSMKAIFMEKAVNAGLYKWEGQLMKEQIENINKYEIDKLRRKVKVWKIKGIFKDKTEANIQREKRIWEVTNNIEGKIPNMEFLIKTHKPGGLQMRNVSPKNNACTYYTSIILTDFLEETLRRSWELLQYYDTNIYDTVKFSEELQSTILRDDEDITIYDIKEMFNTINTDILMEIIERHIDQRKYNKDTIMDMVKYDIKEANWILNDGILYKQNKGIPMGSPTSTIYAKIYTDYFIMINKKELERNGLRILRKYVDDILIIHKKGCEEEIRSILEKEMMLGIKMEDKGIDVDYLDITILTQSNGSIETKWNRKEYVSSRSIHRLSQIARKTKEATLVNRIIRTTRISSEKHIYDCLQINIEDFINNGYNAREIRNLMNESVLKIKSMNFPNAGRKIIHLEECIKSLSMKIRKEKEMYKLGKTKETNWRGIYRNIKARQSNKNRKLKGILQMRKTQNKTIENSRYIRIPHNIGNNNINQKVQGIFKNRIHIASTTRKNRKMETIIRESQGGKKDNKNNPQTIFRDIRPKNILNDKGNNLQTGNEIECDEQN